VLIAVAAGGFTACIIGALLSVFAVLLAVVSFAQMFISKLRRRGKNWAIMGTVLGALSIVWCVLVAPSE
jgi:hypothetical protein